jgi:hypothetical protein
VLGGTIVQPVFMSGLILLRISAARYLRTFVEYSSGRGSGDGVGQQHDNPDARLDTQSGQICNGFVEPKTGSDKR